MKLTLTTILAFLVLGHEGNVVCLWAALSIMGIIGIHDMVSSFIYWLADS